MNHLTDDHIGPWTETKLHVLREYGKAYSTILAAQARFKYVYIDAFASSGQHTSRTTGQVVLGSPLIAMRVQPPFTGIHVIELNPAKADQLRRRMGHDPRVQFHEGDCNVVLPSEVFPLVRYEDYRRGLCVLDPYGLNLDWSIIEQAGKLKTLDTFINFPIHDANRNALWQKGSLADSHQTARLTRIWGDESWKELLYTNDLFGNLVKDGTNDDVAVAYQKRLKEVAGFEFVPKPLILRNRIGAAVFYLFFASQNATAERVVKSIFKKYQT